MRRLNLTQSTLAIALGGLLALTLLCEPSNANPSNSNVRQGLPGRRISGGSRSNNTACLTTPNQPVVAIMPKSNLGLTLSEYPTFWFSLPAISADRTLEFVLYDSAGELVYTENFEASGKAGIASLSLPEAFSPLSAEENYRWYLSVICDPSSRSEDLVVTGWIRRLQPNSTLQAQLAYATPQERLSIYETSNLWFETLTTLLELRATAFSSAGPSDAQQTDAQWLALLESIDLDQVITTPLSNEELILQ